MARTKEEIRIEIEAAKDAEPTLANLTSSSNTAIWRLLIDIVTEAIYILELLWDGLKTEVETLAAQRQSGTTGWYAQKVLDWQYGDSVTMLNYVPGYILIDETKKIAKKVSVNEKNGGIIIKVAKDDGGVLIPLTNDEVTALQTYVNEIKFAGTATGIVSLNADIAKPNLKIYYDGQLDTVELETALEQALNDFLNNIPFDGILHLQKMVDSIQLVNGVNDLEVIELKCKANTAGSYTSVTLSYEPESGYFELAPIGTGAGNTIIELIPV